MGRPLKPIDAEVVEHLISTGSKIEEIADLYDVSRDTIERRFAANIRKGRARLKMSLRQWQLKAAQEGNATMLIWLGKNLLSQGDDGKEPGGVAPVTLAYLPKSKREAQKAAETAAAEAKADEEIRQFEERDRQDQEIIAGESEGNDENDDPQK